MNHVLKLDNRHKWLWERTQTHESGLAKSEHYKCSACNRKVFLWFFGTGFVNWLTVKYYLSVLKKMMFTPTPLMRMMEQRKIA